MLHLKYWNQCIRIIDRSSLGSRSSASLPKLPLVIYCRGGIGRVGAVKFKWVEEFAAQGYAVFAPTYRGNEGAKVAMNLVDLIWRM
ncbi:S9 family peptidase [Paenibacillus sp. JCM 10914]|uniref:alpha/beta hydrolase family protein n=1 Tax=Paenibacillus sp. JCM 10914 TaxID=1236974 RepID=UPI0003CC5E73|nr:hypothetical protein [Paenibacillus sp. JCM 10914]GAE04957.1 dipeptidyl aminopeptidases/acylaminoacyl-peptidases-like [Paenibacillus sp. JCM 10914]